MSESIQDRSDFIAGIMKQNPKITKIDFLDQLFEKIYYKAKGENKQRFHKHRIEKIFGPYLSKDDIKALFKGLKLIKEKINTKEKFKYIAVFMPNLIARKEIALNPSHPVELTKVNNNPALSFFVAVQIFQQVKIPIKNGVENYTISELPNNTTAKCRKILDVMFKDIKANNSAESKEAIVLLNYLKLFQSIIGQDIVSYSREAILLSSVSPVKNTTIRIDNTIFSPFLAVLQKSMMQEDFSIDKYFDFMNNHITDAFCINESASFGLEPLQYNTIFEKLYNDSKYKEKYISFCCLYALCKTMSSKKGYFQLETLFLDKYKYILRCENLQKETLERIIEILERYTNGTDLATTITKGFPSIEDILFQACAENFKNIVNFDKMTTEEKCLYAISTYDSSIKFEQTKRRLSFDDDTNNDTDSNTQTRRNSWPSVKKKKKNKRNSLDITPSQVQDDKKLIVNNLIIKILSKNQQYESLDSFKKQSVDTACGNILGLINTKNDKNIDAIIDFIISNNISEICLDFVKNIQNLFIASEKQDLLKSIFINLKKQLLEVKINLKKQLLEVKINDYIIGENIENFGGCYATEQTDPDEITYNTIVQTEKDLLYNGIIYNKKNVKIAEYKNNKILDKKGQEITFEKLKELAKLEQANQPQIKSKQPQVKPEPSQVKPEPLQEIVPQQPLSNLTLIPKNRAEDNTGIGVENNGRAKTKNNVEIEVKNNTGIRARLERVKHTIYRRFSGRFASATVGRSQ